MPGRTPRLDPEAYVDPQAAVIGDVKEDILKNARDYLELWQRDYCPR